MKLKGIVLGVHVGVSYFVFFFHAGMDASRALHEVKVDTEFKQAKIIRQQQQQPQ